MSKKITNAENVDNFLKRRYLLWAMIVIYIMTITLAVLSLAIHISFVYPLVFYLIGTYLAHKRASLKIEISEELKTLKEEKKNKKKKTTKNVEKDTKKKQTSKKSTKKTKK